MGLTSTDTLKHSELGNTKLTRSRRWSCTWNNYNNEEYLCTVEYCKHNCKAFIIGKETGEKGTNHLQMYFEFDNAKTFNQMKLLFPKCHIETAKGDKDSNFKYCSKDNDYVSKPIIPKPPKIIDNLYNWQKDIVKIVESKPDDRTIYWFYEHKGNVGKTSLIKYLLVKYEYCTFSRAHKSADILTVADPAKTCYLFDFARSQEGFAPYSAIEQLKDGLISDSKLKKETRNIVMDSPHVICFANWEPDTDTLSTDRWKITKIG